MKKTLIALAAATLASTSALAAQVTISGIVDAGFAYNNVNRMNEGTTEDFTLDSGNHNGSRVIFKGTEDLGDGYAVSFYLENGFSLDDGTQGQGGRLFGREARLSFETPYGTMSFGRMGALTAGMGTYDIFQFYGDTFDGGWNYAVDLSNWFGRDRYDNMLTLVTPKVAGFTGYFQYSFGTDNLTEDERTGEIYNAERINEMTKTIVDKFSALGYAFATVTPNPVPIEGKDAVNIVLTVDPGRRAYVRHVNITGNTRTRDDVIRREVRQYESAWFDRMV